MDLCVQSEDRGHHTRVNTCSPSKTSNHDRSQAALAKVKSSEEAAQREEKEKMALEVWIRQML